MTGTTVSHYEILEKLGGGGMGVVYKARDKKLDRLVALKFLPPALTHDPKAKQRFIREARAASALDHANICTVYEVGETTSARGEAGDGRLFIAMAYYQGQTLKKTMAQGPLPVEEALDYAMQIAEGLSRAHEVGMVHRDVKPANVMVTERGQVKLVDFGLAKMAAERQLTKTGATVGTAAYMSPEQARGEGVDHRSDIWSLGVVLYEMLTGERPFRGAYAQAVLYGVLNTDPVPVRSVRPEVPEALAAVVERALQKDPSARYSCVDDLLSDLQRVAAEREGGASPSSLYRSILTERSLRRRLAFSVGLIIVLAVIVTFLFVPSPSAAFFSERDWILITDFENHTGDEVFDHSLHTALTVSIEQSRYVNVFPEQRTAEVLRRMRRVDAERLNAALGREVAQREGLKVILVPSISRVGDAYALTASVQDVQTGEDLRSEIVHAEGEDEVLGALNELAQEIRRDLGETLPAIERQSKPLVKVTTASLDALKQFALGRERLIDAEFEEAKFHFERALEIDSAFTAAQASLGMLHLERSADAWAEGFHRETGRALLAQAVQQVDDLTELEQYTILAFYAQAVEGKPEEAAAHYRTLLEFYPDRFAAHNNLGRVYEAMRRYEEAAQAYKEAIRLNPYSTITYNGLNNLYLVTMGRLDSALVWCKRHVQQNPDNFTSHSLLGYAYLGLDSLDQAQQALEQALTLNPRSGRDLFRLARVHWLQGRLDQAIEPLQRIQEFNPETWAGYWMALLYARQGRAQEARAQFNTFRRIANDWVATYPDNGLSYIAQGLVLAHLGQPERGWQAAQKAREVDTDPEVYLGLARLASVRGQNAQALDLLVEGIENGFTDYIWMKIHPDLEPLHDEPRFQQLLDRYVKR